MWSSTGWLSKLTCLLIGGLLLLTACSAAPPLTPYPAPDFTLKTADGTAFRLADFRGRLTLINFWATWCEPCKQEMPLLQREAAAHPDKLAVIGVNMRESAADVQAFAVQVGVTYPLLLNPDDSTQLAYQVGALPITLIMSPAGLIVQRVNGPISADQIEAALNTYR